jgi:hypothetical protein
MRHGIRSLIRRALWLSIVLATGGSLLLGLGIAGIWARSYRYFDSAGWIPPRTRERRGYIRHATSWSADSYRGRVYVHVQNGGLPDEQHDGFWSFSARRQPGWPASLDAPGWLGFAYERQKVHSTPYHYFETRITFPHWSIVIASLAVPAACMALALRGKRRARRQRSGLCSRCDYDLTGNVSGVCPECGQAIASQLARVDTSGAVSP